MERVKVQLVKCQEKVTVTVALTAVGSENLLHPSDHSDGPTNQATNWQTDKLSN
jgi:hypothetical protein